MMQIFEDLLVLGTLLGLEHTGLQFPQSLYLFMGEILMGAHNRSQKLLSQKEDTGGFKDLRGGKCHQ